MIVFVFLNNFNVFFIILQYFNSSFSVFFRAAFLYTDIYLLVSGVLTAYGMSKDIASTGEISWIRRLFGRIIRF